MVVGKGYTHRYLTNAEVREIVRGALDTLRDEDVLVVPRAGEMLYRVKA